MSFLSLFCQLFFYIFIFPSVLDLFISAFLSFVPSFIFFLFISFDHSLWLYFCASFQLFMSFFPLLFLPISFLPISLRPAFHFQLSLSLCFFLISRPLLGFSSFVIFLSVRTFPLT
jgi:hypothetical protein